jgi:hypothetical protein
MKWDKLLLAASFGLTTLSASTIGTFSLTGDFFVNGTTSITWQNTDGTPDQATISNAGGIYAGLNNQTVTIETLDSATEPAGMPFPDTLFVVMPSGFEPLLINFLYAGVNGPADCGAPPSAGPPAQLCTPPLLSGAMSPFNLQNYPPPDDISSTAGFSMSGDVEGGSGETWFGTLTSQFNVPFQTLLAALGPDQNKTVTDSYSATFTVSSSTPETSTLSMCALGLALILAARSRNLISRVRR